MTLKDNGRSRPPHRPQLPEIEEILQQITLESIGSDFLPENATDFPGFPVDTPILDLGISSLGLVEGMRRVHEQFGVLISIRRVIEGQVTLGELALLIDRELNSDETHGRGGDSQAGAAARGHSQQRIQIADSQRHVAFLQAYSSEASAAYNEAVVVRFKGGSSRSTPDIGALQAAVREASKRYEAMSTALDSEHDALMIGSVEAVELAVRSIEADEVEGCLSEVVSKPLDGVKRLFRADVIRVADKESYLVLVGHSLVIDRHSLNFILRQIVDLYNFYAQGEPPEMTPPQAPPVLQWSDYLSMGNAEGARAARQKDWEYWSRNLSPEPPQLELPGDTPRPAVKKYLGARIETEVEASLEARVQDWAMKVGIEPAAAFFTAFSGYLHRITNQQDFVIGVESERILPEVDIQVVANACNMLCVRSAYEPGMSFLEYARSQANLLGEANTHRLLSFAELIQLSHPPNDQSKSPIFTAAFRYEQIEALPTLDGFNVQTIIPPRTGARYDLELAVYETPEGSRLACDYSTELFEATTIHRWLSGIQTFLISGLENENRPCGWLELMEAEEKKQLLETWNETSKDIPRQQTVFDQISAQARTHPDRRALQFANESMTYGKLMERVESLAAVYYAAGVLRGDRVGILLERSLDMVPAMLAAWRLGALYVPLEPSFPQPRLAFMLADAQAQVVITHEKYIHLLADRSIRTICLEDYPRPDPFSVSEIKPAAGSDSAMVLFTSGSTGKPKGVEVRHAALLNSLSALQEYLDFQPSSSMLALTTISFDISSNELLMPLISGGCVVIGEEGLAADGLSLADRIDAVKPSHVQATVSTWKMVLSAGWRGNPAICLVSAGEALDRATAERLLPKCGSLWNMYGPTETTVYSTAYRVVSEAQKPMRIGRPFPNTQIYILDSQLQPVPIGAIGALYIGGEGLAVGYWNRPEITAERFIPNPSRAGERMYLTGDLARYLPNGDLICLGRMDDQLKIHGVRIEPGEIEQAIKSLAGIHDAVVVPWVDGHGEVQLVGHLISSDGAVLAAQEIRAQLRTRLPEVMIPSQIVFTKAYPRTANGKIQRSALPAPQKAEAWLEAGQSNEPPSTPVEQTLAKIWAGILDVDLKVIGRDSDFMNLGGHSLLMTALVIEVRKAFEVRFNLREFFDHSTLRKFGKLIEERRTRQDEKIDPGHRSGATERISHAYPRRDAEWARQRMTFLQREAMLPNHITPRRGLAYQAGDLHTVFMTGASGFLGAYLVAEILKQTPAKLICLARPKRNSDSKKRIENQMRRYGLWEDDPAWQSGWDERIWVVEGDVTLPRMGLADAKYETLAFESDAILHSAAHVNFIYPYEALRATNVHGLHEVIRFAFHGRIKPIHHISTAAIWPMGSEHTYYESESIEHSGLLNLGYDEAKWVAERCLLHAADRGLPVARYRPGEIGGDSVSGRSVTDHFLFACLKGFLQFGAFPELDIEVDVAPVDYVAKALVHLIFYKNSLQRAFHLTNPERRRMSEALATLRNMGYQFVEMPFEDLRDRLVNSSDFSQNALFAYQAALEDMTQVSMQLPTYDTSQTLRELEGSGIVCPPADEKLLETYLSYLVKVGFLPIPDALAV